MGIYARRPWRFVGQLSADVFVLLWVVAWALLGRLVHGTILGVAQPARETATAAGKLSTQVAEAAEQAGRLPGVGRQLRQPLDAAAGPLSDVIAAANDQVVGVERLADLMGWLVFLIPVTIVLALWLPRRIAFFVRARAAQRYIDSSADLDLFALRAMVSQPMHVLAQISPDPVAAWRARDATVIHKLAEVELRRSGLRMPTSAGPQHVPEGG
jgi:hypothetical protein